MARLAVPRALRVALELILGLRVASPVFKSAMAMPDGTTPTSEVEEAYAAWIADRPGAARVFSALGAAAVPYATRVLTGEVVVPGPKSAMMRYVAANVLGDTGSELAVDPLLVALTDDYMNVRRCAALALGKLGAKRAIPALQKLAEIDPYVYQARPGKEPIALVRVDAEKALKMLGEAK